MTTSRSGPIAARVAGCRIELCVGDITTEDVDAVVNAANSALAGGGGVDGAIHAAAGHAQMRAALEPLGGCAVGDAKITPGFALPARHVIHAVGPRYGVADAPDLLASAYRRSLEVAVAHGCESVALPWLSTGVFGYPLDEAAPIALATTAAFLVEHRAPARVRFVTFDAGLAGLCADALRDLAARTPGMELSPDD